MQGPSFLLQSEDEDEVIDIGSTRPTFQIPARPGSAGNGLGTNLLINPRKMSPDVMSMSSGSSVSGDTDESDRSRSEAGSGRSGSEDDYESEEGSPVYGGGAPPRPGWGAPPPRDMHAQDGYGARIQAERSRVEAELQEKKEIMYQMDRLEAKGYRLPRKFTMQSDMEEMRAEFHRILREKEVDASIRFQQKMMMAFVTGIEFLNSRFDPFDVKLEGWSEQVHENIGDYDDIFEELHEKYKSTGKKMAPELRLLMSLSGSAFMFHLTNSMFKQTPLPGVEQVLRSNPELMKQFQQAAAQQTFGGFMPQAPPPQGPSPAARGPQRPQMPSATNAARGPGGGLFSMVGSMFSGPMMAGMPPPPAASRNTNVDSIIDNIHAEISSRPASNINRVETMSVSDGEIESIIEDVSDMNILGRNAPRRKAGGAGGKKTLDL